jgi:membrane fusion protein (multidrug efflux system)
MKKITLLISLWTSTLLLSGCHSKKTPPPGLPVDVQTVHAQDIAYGLNYPAFVQGVVDYKVVPRISGTIYKQYYTEGTLVKKNKPLYLIDPRPFEWQLKAYEGQLIKDKAARDNHEIIYHRYQALYRDKAVSKQDVELARIQYLADVGNVTTDEANIGQEKLNLLYCLVRSPADGYIAERRVTVGTMVNAFKTVLNKINSVNRMYLLFSMPENQRLEIEDGYLNKTISIPSNYRFPIDIELANGKKILDAGYVEFIGTRIALNNGAWNMRAYVNNRTLQNKLLAGQYVTVYIKGIVYHHVFSVPQIAVMQDDKGQFVYVAQEKKAVKRYVTTGKMYQHTRWMIRDGLKDGEQVVTKGNIRLTPGQDIIIDNIKDK